jgi:hypothetical protein
MRAVAAIHHYNMANISVPDDAAREPDKQRLATGTLEILPKSNDVIPQHRRTSTL